jgi:hypothetical protein
MTRHASYKRTFAIDLDKIFPGQKIITFQEFIRVDFQNKSVEAYGSSRGLLGDFKNRETLVRDGSTVLNKFAEYGSEWQVIPSDPRLFHIVLERPQFPASQVRLKLLAQVSLMQPLARTVPMTSWSLKIWAWLVGAY